MALVEVKVPDIGDFDEVTVIELMVKVGDTVKAEQSLITVESDKASMEIPSSHAGVVKEIKVAIGGKVKEGSLVLVLEAAGAAAAPAAESKAAVAPAAPAQAAPVSVATAPAAAPSAPAASGPVEVRVPDIGDFKDVAVIELLVKVGDTVKVEQSLITVESDKASMEIPSSTAGVVKEIKVKLGDTVNIGDLVVILEGVAAGSATQVSVPNAAVATASSIDCSCSCRTCTRPWRHYAGLAPRVAFGAQVRPRAGRAIDGSQRQWPQRPYYRCRRAELHSLRDERRGANAGDCCTGQDLWQ
jgi:pyruvate dehydrogenase E2 component (dihydrolipoamide acetyltransferase)